MDTWIHEFRNTGIQGYRDTVIQGYRWIGLVLNTIWFYYENVPKLWCMKSFVNVELSNLAKQNSETWELFNTLHWTIINKVVFELNNLKYALYTALTTGRVTPKKLVFSLSFYYQYNKNTKIKRIYWIARNNRIVNNNLNHILLLHWFNFKRSR